MQISAIKGNLKIKKGNAAIPEPAGHRIIIQFVSDSGKYVNDSLSKRWSKLASEYKRWYLTKQKFDLGNIQEIAVQSDTIIVQAITIKDDSLQKESLQKCVKKIADLAQYYRSSIIISKTAEEWNLIEDSLKILLNCGINVTVYESESK